MLALGPSRTALEQRVGILLNRMRKEHLNEETIKLKLLRPYHLLFPLMIHALRPREVKELDKDQCSWNQGIED